MNLGRTDDMFKKLVSFSSPAKGRQLHAQEHFPTDHKWNQLNFRMATSILFSQNTAWRSIMVQWDETSPRPYTRQI